MRQTGRQMAFIPFRRYLCRMLNSPRHVRISNRDRDRSPVTGRSAPAQRSLRSWSSIGRVISNWCCVPSPNRQEMNALSRRHLYGPSRIRSPRRRPGQRFASAGPMHSTDRLSMGLLIARCCQAAILCLRLHDGSDHFVGAGRGCGDRVIAGDERNADRNSLRQSS